MQRLSRLLIRVGILLAIAAVLLALLLGLSVGLFLWHDEEYTALAAVLKATGFLGYAGSIATAIGGIAAVVVGLTLKAVAWGLRHH